MAAVQEGLAEVEGPEGSQVFYNKAQVVNRDLSILAMRWLRRTLRDESERGVLPRGKRHAGSLASTRGSPLLPLLSGEERPEGLRVLEGMAATGLRGIRYAKEVEGVGVVVANDTDERAVKAITENARRNNVAGTVVASHGDCRELAIEHDGLFEAVDVDPYGSPSHLLESAIQGVAEGGMLMATATDLPVLCGNSPEVCWTKYGSFSFRAKYHHEQAVRILLNAINAHAARLRRVVVPVLSACVDFYARIFVRVYTSKSGTKASPLRESMIAQCVGCDTFKLHQRFQVNARDGSKASYGRVPEFPRDCPDCGWRMAVGGPIWNGPLHDPDAVAFMRSELDREREAAGGVLDASGKARALLTNALEEDQREPLFFHLHSMAATLRGSCPSMTLIRSALINQGYKASVSHADPLALKTDAPSSAVWDAFRSWHREHPMRPRQNTPGAAILSAEPSRTADFSRAPGSIPRSKQQGEQRFPPNPEAHWGPATKPARGISQQSEENDPRRLKRKKEDGDS